VGLATSKSDRRRTVRIGGPQSDAVVLPEACGERLDLEQSFYSPFHQLFPTMSALPDGEYLLTNVQWRRQNRDGAFRPLHGFTTGHLVVEGGSVEARARFNDQFLSNRFSDLEEDGIPVVLRVQVLERDDPYTLVCAAPTLDRAGASYQLQVHGDVTDAQATASHQ